MFATTDWIFCVRREHIIRVPTTKQGVDEIKFEMSNFETPLTIKPDQHPEFIYGNIAVLLRATKWMVVYLLTAEVLIKLHTIEMPVRDVILDDGYLVIASHFLLILVDLATKEVVEVACKPSPTCLCVTPNSRVLVGDVRGLMSLFDVQTREKLQTFGNDEHTSAKVDVTKVVGMYNESVENVNDLAKCLRKIHPLGRYYVSWIGAGTYCPCMRGISYSLISNDR